MAYNENGLTKLAALQDLAEQIAADYATKAALEQVSDRVEEIATIGGEPNVITAVKNNGEALPVTDKAVDIGASISAAVAAADHLQRKKVDSVDDIDPAAQGADRFISNKVAYSADGITWAEATLPVSAEWNGVSYGGGKFVAVAGGSNTAAYSTDGITWKAATLPVSTNWFGVTYGDGKFVAIASLNPKVACSTDGITWKTAALPAALQEVSNWYGVTYGDGKFVAVAYNSNKAAYSSGKGPVLPCSTPNPNPNAVRATGPQQNLTKRSASRIMDRPRLRG